MALRLFPESDVAIAIQHLDECNTTPDVREATRRLKAILSSSQQHDHESSGGTVGRRDRVRPEPGTPRRTLTLPGPSSDVVEPNILSPKSPLAPLPLLPEPSSISCEHAPCDTVTQAPLAPGHTSHFAFQNRNSGIIPPHVCRRAVAVVQPPLPLTFGTIKECVHCPTVTGTQLLSCSCVIEQDDAFYENSLYPASSVLTATDASCEHIRCPTVTGTQPSLLSGPLKVNNVLHENAPTAMSPSPPLSTTQNIPMRGHIFMSALSPLSSSSTLLDPLSREHTPAYAFSEIPLAFSMDVSIDNSSSSVPGQRLGPVNHGSNQAGINEAGNSRSVSRAPGLKKRGRKEKSKLVPMVSRVRVGSEHPQLPPPPPKQCARGAVPVGTWIGDPRARKQIQANRDPELYGSSHSLNQPDLDEDQFQRSEIPSGSYQLSDSMFSMLDNTLPLILPEPEHQALSPQGYHFVLYLCVACQRLSLNTDSNHLQNRLVGLFQNLKKEIISCPPDGGDASNYITSLISQLAVAEDKIRQAEFSFMIGTIQFRNQIASICNARKQTKQAVLRSLEKQTGKSEAVLARYVSDGAKYSILASGGTIFLLAIIAVSGLKPMIRDLKMDILLRLSYMFKCPNPTQPAGKHIIEDIIPLISALRQKYRLTFSTMFTQEIAQTEGFMSDMEVGNLKQSDTFFNSMTYNALIKQRCPFTWQLCLTPLDDSVQVLSCVPSSYINLLPYPTNDNLSSFVLTRLQPIDDILPTIHGKLTPIRTIDTPFNPQHEKNASMQYPRAHENKPLTEKRHLFTKAERKYAQKAEVPISPEELETMLCKQLSRGKKTDGKYLHVLQEILKGEPLRFNDCNGDFFAILCPHMPDHLRNKLLSFLKLCTSDRLQYTDSEAGGKAFSFSAFHFYWWNKYRAHGHAAPSDIEPSALRKEGNKRLNSAQYVPHTTREIHEHSEEYQSLKNCFEEVFVWIKTELERLLPKEYKIISQFAEVLPCDAFSPTHPFSGFVVNFNITTQIHRDTNDNVLCIVMAISDDACTGGDLCLLEPGLRIELKSGDMIIFRSKDITHFNLHFKGVRASLVLHSDSFGDNWVEDRNGWEHNVYMHTKDKLTDNWQRSIFMHVETGLT